MRLADDYSDARYTSSSGKRIVVTGDAVLVDDGYPGGGTIGQTYRYVGPSKRIDLGTADYTDTTLWVPIGGENGGLYRYLGPTLDPDHKLDLGLQDYSDTSLWQLISGDEGIVYEWLGPTTELDLSGPDPAYTDLGWWKPVLGTSLIPQGLNVSKSNSYAVGGVIVLNDVRSSVKAYVEDVQVTAGALTVRALETALISAVVDASFISAGGSAFGEIGGDSWAIGAVIATNTVLSEARAYVADSDVQTIARTPTPVEPDIPVTTGDVIVDAENVSQIDAVTKNASESQGNTVGITLAFNTIGWKSQNFLFRAVDAIIGDPLIANAFDNQQPALVEAKIVNSRVRADGDVSVTGLNEAAINATVSNEASSIVEMIEGAESVAVGGLIASNMVNIQTRSSIELDLDGATVYSTADPPAELMPGDARPGRPAARLPLRRRAARPAGPTIDLSAEDFTSADWVWINSVIRRRLRHRRAPTRPARSTPRAR